METNGERATSSAVSIALAWLVVVLPAAWGVYNTVLRAAKLFQ
jgi:hypothetical protein